QRDRRVRFQTENERPGVQVADAGDAIRGQRTYDRSGHHFTDVAPTILRRLRTFSRCMMVLKVAQKRAADESSAAVSENCLFRNRVRLNRALNCGAFHHSPAVASASASARSPA